MGGKQPLGGEPKPQRVFQINLDRLAEVANKTIRRASAFMALGLRSADDETIRSANLEANFAYRFLPDELTEEQSADVRKTFKSWILGNGLRELEQGFAIFLDRIYEALVIFQTKQIPPAASRIKRFHADTNLAGKLDRIKDDFDVAASYRDYFETIATARNALSHNLGIIAARHCRDGKSFTLRWRGQDMVAGPHTISGPFEPFMLEEATAIEVRVVERTREFQIGESIEITSHDLSEICLNFQLQTNELIQRLIAFGAEHGVDVLSPPTKPEAKAVEGAQ